MDCIMLCGEYERIWDNVLSSDYCGPIRSVDDVLQLMIAQSLQDNKAVMKPTTVTVLGRALQDSISITSQENIIGELSTSADTDCSLERIRTNIPRQLPMERSIPRIIHYCWFGRGKKSGLIKRCLRSWRKWCHDWEIVEWNEDNFDVTSTLWTKQAYEDKKYAFVSDYVRLKVLREVGGIYLDTDVQLLKPLDDFLVHDGFCGFETDVIVGSCVMGARAGHPVIAKWMDWYENRGYMVDGQPNTEPNVTHMTLDMTGRGLLLNGQMQCVDHMVVFPQRWFCPPFEDVAGHKLTKDTCAVHYFDSSWRTPKGRRAMKRAQWHATPMYRWFEWMRYLPNRIIRRVVGDKAVDCIKKRLGK